jgi:hypothetical protein
MANRILLKRNTSPNKDPSVNDLAVGELALNTADRKIFFKHADNSLQYVKSIYSSCISELQDVDTSVNSGPVERDGLVWNVATGSWIPGAVSEPISIVSLDNTSSPVQTINNATTFSFDHKFNVVDLGNGAAKVESPLTFQNIVINDDETISADSSGNLNISVGTNLDVTVDNVTKTIALEVSPDSVFDSVTINQDGSMTFGDGSQQFTKAPRIYTNADAEAGLSLDDMVPGDYYYDDITESIFIMIDTGYGYNDFLDLTVRA